MRTSSCLACAAYVVFCVTAFVSAGQVIYQSFGAASNPDGWVVQGEKNASDRFTPGEPKTLWDFFRGGQGFIRLTTTGVYQRASAFYTNEMVWSTEWRLEAEIHMERGADGLAFSWVNVDLPVVDGITKVDHLLGGFGNFVGAPRGPGLSDPDDDGLGWYTNLMGYSVQFLTFSNDWITGKLSPASATNYEASLCRNLRNWKPPIRSSIFDYLGNPEFFVTDGFVKIVLLQTMVGSEGRFALTWGPGYHTTNSWAVSDYPDYPAFFGVSAGTGDSVAHHDVRNFTLEGNVVPEPTVWLGIALIALCAGRRRR